MLNRQKIYIFSNRESSGFPRGIVYALFVFGFLILVAFYLIGYYKNQKADIDTQKQNGTAQGLVLPTSPIDVVLKSDKNIVSKVATDEGKIKKEDLSIVVLNGSGEPGVGAWAADYLREMGWRIVRVGNADDYYYANVSVFVKKEKSEFLPLLKQDLSANDKFASVSAGIKDYMEEDARVIIGQ